MISDTLWYCINEEHDDADDGDDDNGQLVPNTAEVGPFWPRIPLEHPLRIPKNMTYKQDLPTKTFKFQNAVH